MKKEGENEGRRRRRKKRKMKFFDIKLLLYAWLCTSSFIPFSFISSSLYFWKVGMGRSNGEV